ncbi:MAG: Z1 domain-containing protein, partial [Bacteroidota bacterium]
AIVLTKGTKALTRQTYERLRKDFVEFARDDKVQICDIMHLPKNFTKFELQQKLIIVVKKETNNLRRIITALTETYPDLKSKNLLIIDDEADYASIGFRRDSAAGIQINKIPGQINDLRKKVASTDFLQVTATPYSLYLQPEDLAIPNENLSFKPIRPVFTVILDEYAGYVGGDFYFDEAEIEDSIAFHLYEEIPIEELHTLRKEDRRSFRVEDALNSQKIKVLRKAIMSFVVGGCVRRIQQRNSGEREKKYSFIVHTEHSKACHAWQERVLRGLIEALEKSTVTATDRQRLGELIHESYDDVEKSVRKGPLPMPAYDEVETEVLRALQEDHVMITTVNSDKDAQELLDEDGQLRLRTPLNIFIGGQILDRGVTVDNLTGFYYGRRPMKFQQDTVLQHSRMYGNRPKADLAVTRFYTALPIYEIMERIHEFDTTLREVLSRNLENAEVVFIRKDPSDRIVPCSPNKIMLSKITTLKPFKRMLPVGFQTSPKIHIEEATRRLDKLIMDCQPKEKPDEPFLIDVHLAKHIINEINGMLQFEKGSEWDIKAVKASIEYLCTKSAGGRDENRIWCLARRNRNVKRVRAGGRPFNAPDTAHVEGRIAREIAADRPMLMLFRHDGRQEDGWNGSPFWWPVLWAPKNTKATVFTSEAID